MKADLHIHSNFSDGDSCPEDIVRIAIDKGIDCICIVDHNEIEGSIRAMKFGFDKDILVIPGIEVLTKSGDILGINVKKKITQGLSPEETIREIRAQGGLAVIPHAFHWPTDHFRGGEKKILNIQPDAIEIFNASVLYNLVNKKALNLAMRNNFAFTAGSDAHCSEFVGRGYIKIFKNISSEREVLEEIKAKRIRVGGTNLSYWEIFKNFRDVDSKHLIRIFRRYFPKR